MGKARGRGNPSVRTHHGRSNGNSSDTSYGGSGPAIARSTGETNGAGESSQTERAILQEAVRDLRGTDSLVKTAAIRALGRLSHRRGAPALIDAYDDPSEAVRSECIIALAQLREPAAASVFKTALFQDASSRVRLAAVRGVYQLGGLGAAPAITKALKDTSPTIRRRAAVCLGWLDARTDAGALLPLFRDGDANVRAAAVEAVGTLRFRSAIPGLIKALEDKDPRVRQRANHSLQRITGMSCGTAPPGRAAAYRKIARKWQGWWSVS